MNPRITRIVALLLVPFLIVELPAAFPQFGDIRARLKYPHDLLSCQALALRAGSDLQAPPLEKSRWASWSDLRNTSGLEQGAEEDPLDHSYGAAVLPGPEESAEMQTAADTRIAAAILSRMIDAPFRERLITLLRSANGISPILLREETDSHFVSRAIDRDLAPICLGLIRIRAKGRSLADYRKYLEQETPEARAEFHSLYARLWEALNKSPSDYSSFFRDYSEWGLDDFLHTLSEKWARGDLTYRSEHVAAGQGQEMYTEAIVLYEALHALFMTLRDHHAIHGTFENWLSLWHISIWAYDRNLGNLLQVREGLYTRLNMALIERVLKAPVIEDLYGAVRMGDLLRSWVHPVLADVTVPEELALIPEQQADATYVLSVMQWIPSMQHKMRLYERLLAARRPKMPHLFVFNAFSSHAYTHVIYASNGDWETVSHKGFAQLLHFAGGPSVADSISSILALGVIPMPPLGALRYVLPQRPWLAEAIRWMLSLPGQAAVVEDLAQPDDAEDWFPAVLSLLGDMEQVMTRFVYSADAESPPQGWHLGLGDIQTGRYRGENLLQFLLRFKETPFVKVPPGLEKMARLISRAGWSDIRVWMRGFTSVASWPHPDLESWMAVMGWSPWDFHKALSTVFSESYGTFHHRGAEQQLVIGRLLHLWWTDPRGSPFYLPKAA